ncbi:MAG: hypothetical protein JOZ75_10945 [Candidatus Dormibacteraeota bacterium]|nr:hypothetical protein [Candidatus Dormibacteraeota bacterium]
MTTESGEMLSEKRLLIDDSARTAVREAIASDVAQDWVGLWVFPWWFKRVSPGASEAEMRDATLDLVREMLDAREVLVGDLRGAQDFEPWQLDTDAVIERLDREWRTLGRLPEIGEVAWFAPRG